MAGMGAFLQGIVAGFIAGQAAPTPPTSLLLALSMGDPGQSGATLNEPTGGYARQPVTVSVANYTGDALGGRLVSVTGATVFGPVTNAPWSAVTHGVLMDQSGNILCYGPLGVQRAPSVGDTISFGAGAIQFVVR